MLSRPLTDAETKAVFEKVLKDCVAGKESCIPVGAGLDDKTCRALWAVLDGSSTPEAARAELGRQLDGTHAREAAAEAQRLWDSL